MTVLLDTHFLIWILLQARRLEDCRWIEKYEPWGVSPISLFEIEFLAEVGRVELPRPRKFMEALAEDERFVPNEPPLAALVHLKNREFYPRIRSPAERF